MINNAIQGQEEYMSQVNIPQIISSFGGLVFLGGCLAVIITISTIQQVLTSRRTALHPYNEKPVTSTPSDAINEAIKRISKKHRYVSVLRDSLPPGWEVGINVQGDIYYVDHNQQKTSWNHPTLSPEAIRTLLLPIEQQNNDISLLASPVTELSSPVRSSFSSAGSSSAGESSVDSIPNSPLSPLSGQYFTGSVQKSSPLYEDSYGKLPEGWEMAVTPMGIPYYINHSTRQTTWVDPRTRKPSVASTQSVFLLAQLHSKQKPHGPSKGKLRNTSSGSRPKLTISTVNGFTTMPINETAVSSHGQTTGYSVHH